MKPDKRKSSTSPEKPDAKRVADKATPPRQAIPEQIDVDNIIPIVKYGTEVSSAQECSIGILKAQGSHRTPIESEQSHIFAVPQRIKGGAVKSNKVEITKYNTLGDGNCFFHAVFGEKNNVGSYRTQNTYEMRSEWFNFLNQFSTNTNEPSKIGLHHPDMPSGLKELLTKHLNANILNDNNNKYNLSKSGSVEDVNLYKDYLKAIQQSSYFVFVEEIPVLASLANISITLNIGDNLDTINPDQALLGNYNTNKTVWGNKQEAIIYLAGIHFSHAEVLNSHLIEEELAGSAFILRKDKIQDSTTKPSCSSDAKETVSIEDLKEFFSQLFGRELSSKECLSIKIDDQKDTYQVKVQRPPIVGESIEQMRDITSVMFIKTALANKVKETSVGKDYLINNFIEYILAISNQIDGIELNKAQYQEYKKQKTSENGLFKLKFTKQEDNTRVVKYLIANDNSDEYSEISDFDEDAAKVSHTEYLQKYIKGVLNGLRIMLNNDDTVKTAGEFIAKFITSLIDPEGELFQKDSILFKEVRLYKLARKAKDPDDTNYKILYNQDVITQIDNGRFGTGKSPFIRIIDKKGEIIKQAVKALNIIDLLVSNLHGCIIDDKTTLELCKEYNDNYNFQKKLISDKHRHKLDDYLKYKERFVQDEKSKEYNISDIFHYHAAKQLYSICDFRSLGNKGSKMLAPARDGDADEDILKVYPSATGQTIEQYSRQDQPDIEPVKLVKQAIAFVSFMLSPFLSLRSHVPVEEKEELSPLQKISKAFFNLLKTDYNDDLDQQWSKGLEQKFDTDIIENLKSDLLGDNVQNDLEF